MDQHEFELQKYAREQDAQIRRIDKELESTRIEADLTKKQLETGLEQLRVDREEDRQKYVAATERAVAIVIPLSVVAILSGVIAAVVTLVGGCS